MLPPEYLKEILPNPKHTVSLLNKSIIGQNQAKYTLALMLLNQSILSLHSKGQIALHTIPQKTNVLLIGPTGTGKTALMTALSEINHSPISINDITSCTAGGYIGGKVEDILVNHVCKMQQYTDYEYPRLKLNSNISVTKMEFLRDLSETGIVYIDEIDKICRRNSGDGIDINGDMVQNELLKFLDSGLVNLLMSRVSYKSRLSQLDTKNILFVCGGAFEGLDKIISQRLSKKGSIGFNANLDHMSLKKEDLLKEVTTDDLIKYGFKPEFLGRVPLKAVLSPISAKMMSRIITEPQNSIFNQYSAILNVFGIDTEISKAGLKEIATIAADMGMGARALKPIFSKLFEEVLFNLWELPSDTVFVITKKDVQKLLGHI